MNLEHLVTVIQEGAIAASKALQSQNLKLIDQYFEPSDTNNEKKSLKESMLSSMDGWDKEEAISTVDKVMEQLTPELIESFERSKSKLKPKTVIIEYPMETAKGIVIQEVVVPLITLVPISCTEVSQVKFKTTLEVNLVDEDLSLSFPEKGEEDQESF